MSGLSETSTLKREQGNPKPYVQTGTCPLAISASPDGEEVLFQFFLSAKRCQVCATSPYLCVSHTFWIMMVNGPSIWKPLAKYMTLHHPSTRAKDMGTTSPFVLVRRITMVTRIMQA